MQHVRCVGGRNTRQTKHCSFWSSRWIVIFRCAMLSFWWCWALYFIWDPVGECVIKYCSVLQISDQKMCICGRAGVAHSLFKSAANGKNCIKYTGGIKCMVLSCCRLQPKAEGWWRSWDSLLCLWGGWSNWCLLWDCARCAPNIVSRESSRSANESTEVRFHFADSGQLHESPEVGAQSSHIPCAAAGERSWAGWITAWRRSHLCLSPAGWAPGASRV